MEKESPFYIDKSYNPNYPIGGSYESNSSQKSKKSKFLVLFIIISLVFIGSLAGVLASRIWDPIWNPFRPSPDKVLARAFLKQKEIKTQSEKIFLYADIKTASNDDFSIELNMEGKTDIRDENFLKSSGKFDHKVLIGPIIIPFSGETIIMGEEIYFKLDDLFLPEFFSLLKMSGEDFFKNSYYLDAFESALKEMTGKWIRISPGDKYRGMRFSINTRKPKLLESINNIIVKYPVLKAKKQFSDKEINGNKCYHYLLALDKKNLMKLMPEILETIKNSGTFPMVEENYFDKVKIGEEIKEIIDELLSKIGEITTEIWIGKNDYYIYQIKGEKTIDVSTISDGLEKGVIKIGWDASASNFNQSIEIKAPENSVGIVELIYSILDPIWNKMPPPSVIQPNPSNNKIPLR